MKQLWSDDPQVIREELVRIITQKTPVILYQKGQSPQRTIPAEIFKEGEQTLLLLHKETAFPMSREACLLLYQPRAGAMMRGFSSPPLLETNSQLGVLLPSSIIHVQRRKHPRFVTSPRSVATFTRQGSQYLNHGGIENICIEGAKLVGNFSQHIRKGDAINPLTLTLRLGFGDYEEKITATEAYVRRVRDLGNDTTELGVQFIVNGSDLARLESYLAIRALEESAPASPDTSSTA
ncbi:hypothetical protein ACUUL3_09025 [Thiovibrio sp. JS02]